MAREFYDLSGGADRIQTFRVELPSLWRNTECTAHLLAAGEGRVAAADLRVGGRDLLWGEEPHAHQHGGCGVPGASVDLPFAILTDSVEMSEERLNASLLAAVRWRYGVFPEHGFQGDSRFPAVEINTEEENAVVENAGCDETERRNGGGLCPLAAAVYRPEANTKQNLLCKERSVRRTILDQFSQQNSAQPFSKPNLAYLLPADTERLILMLEQSSAMEQQWPAVLAATFHFINSVEEGTELAVVVFGAATKGATIVHLEPTRVVGGNREGLHYRIPRRLSSLASDESDNSKKPVDACLACGLAAAGQLATNTTTLVIFSSSSFSGSARGFQWDVQGVAKPTMRNVVLGSSNLQDRQGNTSATSGSSEYYAVSQSGGFPETASQISSALASSVHLHPGKKFHQER